MNILNDLKQRNIPHAVLAPEIMGNFAGYYVCVPKEYESDLKDYIVFNDRSVLSIPIDVKNIKTIRRQIQDMKMTYEGDYGCVFEPKNENFRTKVVILPEPEPKPKPEPTFKRWTRLTKPPVKKFEKQYFGHNFKPLWGQKEAI